jgi:hypothetical protein
MLLTTPKINCCNHRGLFFLQNCEQRGKNKDAAVRRQWYLPAAGVGRGCQWCQWRIHRHITQHDNDTAVINLWLVPQSLSPVTMTPVISLWIFEKIKKRPQRNTQGPGGHWFMKKTWSRKSRVRLPLNLVFASGLKVNIRSSLPFEIH